MKRLLAPLAALTLIAATAGIALAWQPPTLTSSCAPDENSFAWTIDLPGPEDNYKVDLSWDNFATAPFATIDFGSAGSHDFTTSRGGPILYVRWTSDPSKKASLSGDTELCVQPEPGIEIVKSNDAGDGTIEPGTEVTYTYAVTNTGNTHLVDVVVEDQIMGSDNLACDPVAFDSSDGNDDDILDPGETWTFTCTSTLEGTTSNEACVSANVSDSEGTVDEQAEPVEDCDDNTVEVSHSPEQTVEAGTGTPAASVPNSALGGGGPNPLPTILFSLVLLGSLGTLAYTNVKVVARRNR